MNVLENNEIVDINTLNNTKKFSVAHVLSQAKTFITLSPTNTPALKIFNLVFVSPVRLGVFVAILSSVQRLGVHPVM